MKRLLAALAGILGVAWWRRRTAPPPGPDPADALRAKLAEAREQEPEPADEPAADAPAGVDERRRDVHERARRQIDELRGE